MLILVAAQTLLFAAPLNGQALPIPIKRTFVPNSQAESWPRRDKDWVPIERAELNSLLKVVSDNGNSQSQVLWLDRSTYTMIFNPRTATVKGTAHFEWRSSLNRPSLLPFQPSNLSIQQPVWEFSRQLAILGADRNGKQWVVAHRDEDSLTCQWSRQGTQRMNGIQVELELPNALVSTLHISVPAGWSLKSSRGIARQQPLANELSASSGLSKSTVGSHVGNDRDNEAPVNNTTQSDSAVWKISLGTASTTVLTFQKTVGEGQEEANPPFTWSHAVRAAVRTDSVDLAADVKLDPIVDQLPEVISIQIPNGFRIESLEQDNSPAKWNMSNGNPQRIEVQLRTTPNGLSTSLSLGLHRPLASSRRVAISLPRVIRGLFEGGTLTTSVTAPFVVGRYRTNGLRQVEANASNESMQMSFRQFAVPADIQISGIRDAESESRINIRQYSTFRDNSLTVDLQLAAQSRGHFEFNSLIPRRWEVTGIEHIESPGESSELRWELRSDNTIAPAARKTHRALDVQFPNGIPFKKPVHIRVKAELPAWSKRENSYALPAVLSRHAGFFDLIVNILDRPRADANQPHNETEWTGAGTRMRRLTPEEVVARTKWISDGPGESNPAAKPTNAWHVFVWDEPNSLMPILFASHPADLKNTIKSQSTKPVQKQPARKPVEPDRSLSGSSFGTPVVSMQLNSRVAPGSGRDEHALTWRFLYPADVDQLTFNLPSSATLLKVEFNDLAIAANEQDGIWRIPLAGIAQDDRVTIHYTLPSQSVFLRGTYRCQMPTSRLRVTDCSWEVDVPREFAVVSFADEFIQDDEQDPSPLSWLFGPVGRHRGTPLFNPLSQRDWEGLVNNRSREPEPAWQTASARSGTIPQSLTLHLVDRSRLRAMSWFVLVVTVFVGVTLRAGRMQRRGRIGLVCLVTCIAASSLVPPIFAELIGALILGILFSTLIPRRMIRQPRVQANEDGNDQLPSTVSLQRIPVALLLLGTLVYVFALMLGLIMDANPVYAQETVPAANSRLESIELLVPYEGDRFPIDEPNKIQLTSQVFIQSDQLRALTQLANASPQKPIDSLTVSAEYSIRYEMGDRPRVTADIIVARKIDTGISKAAQPGTTSEIILPIPARFLSGRDSCRVDGLLTAVLPDEDGQNIRIQIPDEQRREQLTGRPSAPPLPTDVDAQPDWRLARLTLELLPESLLPNSNAASDSGTSLLRLPIPALANSVVQIEFDLNSEIARVGASSTPVLRDDPIQLGPTNMLEVIWGTPGEIARRASYSVSLATHIELHPTWSARRTKAVYRIKKGETDQVCWRLPRGARIARDSVASSVELRSVELKKRNNVTMLVVELKEPQSNSFEVEFQWKHYHRPQSPIASALVSESPTYEFSGAGRVPVGKHTIGIVPPPGFVLTNPNDTAQSEDTVIDQWLADWPNETQPRRPQLIASIDMLADLVLAVFPASRRTVVVRQDQAVRISDDSIAEWVLTAEATSDDSPTFRYSIEIGDQVALDSVTVEADDVDRLNHWHFDRQAGVAHLFLKRPTFGGHTIALRGRIPLSEARTASIPNARFQDTQTMASTVTVQHPANTNILVQGPVVKSTNSLPSVPNLAIAVERFDLTGQDPVHLTVERIRESAEAFTMTKIRRSAVANVGVAELELEVHSLREDRFEVALLNWKLAPDSKVQVEFDPSRLSQLHKDSDPESTSTQRFSFQKLVDDDKPLSVRFMVQLGLLNGSEAISPPDISGITTTNVVVADDPASVNLSPLAESTLDSLRARCPGMFDFKPDITPYGWARPIEIVLSDSKSQLPIVTWHEVRLGKRQATIGTTYLMIQAGNRDQVATPNKQNPTSIAFDLPFGTQIISAKVDDKYATVHRHRNGVRFDLTPGLHLIELLWNQAENSRHLKVRREQVRLPRVVPEPESRVASPHSVNTARAVCIVLPVRGSTVSGLVSPKTAQIKQFARDIELWLAAVSNTGSLSHIDHSVGRLLNQLDKASVREDHVSVDSKSTIDRLQLATNSAQPIATSWPPTPTEQPFVAFESTSGDVKMWIVDERLNQILVGMLIAFLATPFLTYFLKLETSDLLAKNSTFSWCLIGLVWWLCLVGSFAGWLVFTVTLLALLVQAILALNHRRAIQQAKLGDS